MASYDVILDEALKYLIEAELASFKINFALSP